MHNLTLKRTLLSSPKKTNFQKVKSIFWTLGYAGVDLGSKSLDIADKTVNVLGQWIANVHDQANTPTPINPDIAENLNNLSPELREKVEKGIKDAISQIMEDDARRYADDKSDSV